MDELIFFHLTDTHLTGGAEDLLFGQVDPAANFRAVAAEIRRTGLRPAFIVISGDLAHAGAPAAYAQLRSLIEEELAPLGAPVLLSLGNHDNRVAFRDVILGERGIDEATPYYYSQRFGGVRVLVLDSMVPGATYGELGEEQLAWLDRELANPAEDGDILVVHHPVVHRGIIRVGEDDLILRDRAELARILTHRSVLGILTGHTHVVTAASFAGTTAFTGTATAFLGDPSTRDGGRMLNGAGFNLCTVRDGTLIVNSIVLPSDQRVLFTYRMSDLAVSRAH
ncbi:MAG: metallophosphoesterase [Chloroflexota bacterium]|nr:metallophosphoesterase [Dehalococcoidia bacterium]MDW8252299.1 metallophosphoesterase [Chloroflexota bacterium]